MRLVSSSTKGVRLFGTQARRTLVASFVLLLALASIALPANAGKPLPPGSTTTIVSSSGCSFTVTYAWSGFSGKGLIASFGFYERLSGGIDASFNLFNIGSQSGASGSVTHTFNFTGTVANARLILARGALLNGRTFQQVSGSSSGTTPFGSVCANPTNP